MVAKYYFKKIFILVISLSYCTRIISAQITVSKIMSQISATVNDSYLSNEEKCRETYTNLYDNLYAINISNLNFNELSSEKIDQILHQSFVLRVTFTDKMRLINYSSDQMRPCLGSIMNLLRALRYIEDYLIEYKMLDRKKPRGRQIKKKFVTLTGGYPNFLINPKYQVQFQSYQDLKSGDLLLSRGNAASSAAIARIARNDMHFSHLSIVYRKESDGKLYTVEAHTEIGNVVAPFQKHLAQKNSRTVVYRFQDAQMAHQAAKMIYEYVDEHKKRTGENIPYDFAMLYQDIDKIFCSEVIFQGFIMASNGAIDVPLYKSKFKPSMIPFLNSLGIDVDEDNIDTFETFAPGDIQFDPRFEMVAEWRNPQKLEGSRLKDMIMTKIFAWMEDGKYKFSPSKIVKGKTYVFYHLRRFPLIGKKTLGKMFPLNMNKSQLYSFMMIEAVSKAIFKNIMLKKKGRGLPFSPQEMQFLIEKERVNDYIRWINNKKTGRGTLFHSIFHPPLNQQ